jgi:type IV pilus assembly protein PilN
MIKINLLPVRAVKKKESARQQLSILLLFLLLLFVGCLGIYSITMAKIKSTQEEIGNSEREIEVLKKKIGEINDIKKLQDDVKKKLDILDQLRRNKTGPAIRFAKLSDSVPEKVWLTKYTENGDNVSIGGVAFTEDLIAELMRNLQATNEFQNIELGVSEQMSIKDLKVKRFEITFTMKTQKVAESAPPQKK